jgi:uncharacterized protein (DUF1778 family)
MIVNKKLKRIIFSVDPDTHKKIKLAATKRNMSMSRYILQAVWVRLETEKNKQFD